MALSLEVDYIVADGNGSERVSNLGPDLHHYLDSATYWLKIASFTHPLLFSALVRGDPLRIYEKALRFPKRESSWQPKVKVW